MKQALILTKALSLLLVIYSCQNNDDKATVSSTDPRLQVKSSFEQQIEKEDKAREEKFQEEVELHEKRLKEKNYRFKVIDHCAEGPATQPDRISEKGLRKPFSAEKEIDDSLINIRFHYIDNCANIFASDFEVQSNKLSLYIWDIFPEAADCECEFEIEFKIPRASSSPKRIYLFGTELEFD